MTPGVLGAGAACFWLALVLLHGVRGIARPWSSPRSNHGSGGWGIASGLK
ncbi:hypothetical protein [Pseudarthrobacter sp. NamE5]